MSAKHGDKGMTGSVPNVRNAAKVKDAKHARLTATVNRRKAGSVGTMLKGFVGKSIR